MTFTASEIRFFGEAQAPITLDSSSQTLSPTSRVWTFLAVNGDTLDKAVLPDPVEAAKDGAVWYLVVNDTALSVAFGLYDSDGTTMLVSVPQGEAVYVSLVDISGTLTWVPSDAKAVTIQAPPSTALTNLYFFHGQSGTVGTPVDEKDATRYNPLRVVFTTAGTATSFDSLQETCAGRSGSTTTVWMLGSSSATPTTSFMAYNSSTEAWFVSQPTGPVWLTSAKTVYLGVDYGGGDIIYEFGGTTTYGSYDVGGGSWTSIGTSSAIFVGTGVSAYLSPELYGMGTTGSSSWYECVKLNTLGDVFIRLALTPSRSWTGSGGLIGDAGFERILGYAPGAALYNPFLDTWTNVTSYTGSNDRPGGSAIGTKFYSFGGSLDSGGDEALSYSMTTDSWTTEATMSGNRSNAQQAAVTV